MYQLLGHLELYFTHFCVSRSAMISQNNINRIFCVIWNVIKIR